MADLDPAAVAAAVASLGGETTATPPATEPTPTPLEQPAQETPAASATSTPELPAATPETKPEEKPPEKMDLPGAKMQAAIRKEQQLRQEREALEAERQTFSAQQRELDEFRQAREAFARGDHRAVFRAFGTNLYEVVQRENEALKAGAKPDMPAPKPDAPKGIPEVEELKREIQQLKESNARAQMNAEFAATKAAVAQNKELKYVARLGDRGATQVFNLIHQHRVENNGELPGDGSWDDAVRVTGQAINKALADDLALLTAGDESTTVPAVATKAAAPGPQANSGTQQKTTLTNSQAAALPVRNGVSSSPSLDEVLAAAAKQLEGVA
jgi:hypothetical protein